MTFVCDDGSTEIDPVGIGMSCDNTSKGMQNSIVASQEGVDQKSLAKLVASFAKTNEAAEGYVDSGSATFTFRRCLPWGNAHYAFCLIVTTEDSGTSSDSESD